MDQGKLVERLERLERLVAQLTGGRDVGYHTANSPLIPFRTPLTSTDWDGDAHSTTAKTLIDVSATFTNAAGEFVPDGAKMILARLIARDSGSAAGISYYFGLAPNDTAASLAGAVRPAGVANDTPAEQTIPIPCDINGDVYYQISASGAGTMDCWLEIWGYWK